MSGKLLYYIVFVGLMLLLQHYAYAQTSQTTTNSFSNLKTKSIAVSDADSITLSEYAIVKGSLTIDNVPEFVYTVLHNEGILVWKQKPQTDSVTVRFRTLPISFGGQVTNKSFQLQETDYAFPIYTYTPADTGKKNFVDFNALDYNGSYARSLSIGNSQDVTLNSNFNLQLNGYILDSVRIEAAITDNTIPFQPDGNTYQLQEFDKLYITFEKGKSKLTAGDYVLVEPNSYFVKYNKRVQGLMFASDFAISDKIQNKINLSGSIAKGQFVRNVFNGSEGNQGPYKLTGNNGEQFFIVLAGTEKVYIDGIPLQRGEDRDYIINYNTGEITFMPRVLITKDKRIQVEFEYQDRNYLNSLFLLTDELKIGEKLTLNFSAYSNQDAKNQPYLQSFSDEQKQFLHSIGDSIHKAFYPNITEDTFASNKILYKIESREVDGILYDTVFVYSTHPDSAKYSLNFSYVGPGKGNYIVSSYNTNGRSYEWVPPINGILQGEYEPVALLVTPKLHQIFTFGADYKIDSFKNIGFELASSRYDPNLYSTLSNNEHWGNAAKFKYNEKRFFGKKDTLGTKKWNWNNNVDYEYVQGKFKAVSPFRNIEFARDWNIDTLATAPDEHLVSALTILNRQNVGSIKYNFVYYQRGATYTANKHIAATDILRKNFKANFTYNIMNADGALQNSRFLRPSATIEQRIPALNNIVIGGKYELEHNEVKDKFNDSLNTNAFSFDVFKLYIRNDESSKTQFSVNYMHRRDDAVWQNDFVQHNNSHNVDVSLGLNYWENHQIKFTGAYRKLNVNNTNIPGEEGGESVVGRFEYSGNIASGFLIPTLLYELGTGQEQKREYTYIEVDAGLGMYMWIDYNGDGVQQANEFELAIFPDQKKFIRIITPTNEYVKVNYVNFNYSLQLNPENILRKGNKNTIKKFAARFSDQLAVQINNRTLSTSGMESFNPFVTHGIDDDEIISNISVLSNTLFFNRTNAKFGAEYTSSFNSGKSLLTYGLEANNQTRHLVKSRWTFVKGFTLNFQGLSGKRGYNSGLDDGRSYRINILGTEPSLTWMHKSVIRITGAYKYEERQNELLYGGELALIRSYQLESRISMRNAGTINLKGTYANITYSGADNTSLAFVMLDALQKGNNWLWYASVERRLGKGIELSLEYEGRKPGTANIVHTGRMSIRALL